ncbi:MAG: hypothetical protein KAG64_09400, partial [Bacteroidales bacterium]|nr:hypothetical protein [Bacteroidales bacterium]
GGLRKIIKPSYFFFLQRKGKFIKEKSIENKVLADRIVEFDGEKFNIDIDHLFFKDGSLNLND